MNHPVSDPEAEKPLRVVALTGGLSVPSRRLRIEQLLPILAQYGINMQELPANISSYPPAAVWKRPAWLAAALAERLTMALRSRDFDLVLLQREMISTLYTWEGLTGTPRVLDVDDAIHLYRGGWAAKKLAQACDMVICGNPYLATWYERWNPNIRILPTAVDAERFTPLDRPDDERNLIIGWIGSGSNLHYLQPLIPALKRLFDKQRLCRLRIVSDRRPEFAELRPEQVEYIPWNPAIEAGAVRGMHIGLMPLHDGAWERGKCSLKMLQYMACGLPVVVSAIGMNNELLAEADIGYGVKPGADWLEPLQQLVKDAEQRQRLGLQGRRMVKARYSAAKVGKTLARYLREV